MPSVGVKLYSVFFKFMLKHRLQNRIQNQGVDGPNGSTTTATFGVTSRPEEESIAAANPVFTDGIATKDIHIDPLTSLSIRIFLPQTCLNSPDADSSLQAKSKVRATVRKSDSSAGSDPNQIFLRRSSYGSSATINGAISRLDSNNQSFNYSNHRRSSYGCSADDLSLKSNDGPYRGYSPASKKCRKLPVMLQFHGGGFVSGSNDSVANDIFCRRIAKLCDVIVLAVGYRLAPENQFPAAFEDGLKVLHWLAKQANLAECSKSSLGSKQIADAFGASMVEPWVAAHGDPSRLAFKPYRFWLSAL